MTHLLRSQEEERVETEETRFENTLFATNYPMWKELYGKEKKKVEDNLDWVTPGDEDFNEMLDEMRSLGLQV